MILKDLKIIRRSALLLFGLLTCVSTACLAQGHFTVSKPHLEIKSDQLIITYNILNSNLACSPQIHLIYQFTDINNAVAGFVICFMSTNTIIRAC